MEKLNYVKVYLYAYPKLGALADAVSDGAEVKALLSFRSQEDALALAERIAGEIACAGRLRMLKQDLDGALAGCSEREKYLLEYKYFRRKSELAGKFRGVVLDCSERSYFRMQNAVLGKVASLLLAKGRNFENFLFEFSDFRPFMRVFKALSEGQERKIVFKRRSRGLTFSGGREKGQNSSCGEGAFLPRSTNTAIARKAAHAAQITAICTGESGLSGSAGPSASPDTSVR